VGGGRRKRKAAGGGGVEEEGLKGAKKKKENPFLRGLKTRQPEGTKGKPLYSCSIRKKTRVPSPFLWSSRGKSNTTKVEVGSKAPGVYHKNENVPLIITARRWSLLTKRDGGEEGRTGRSKMNYIKEQGKGGGKKKQRQALGSDRVISTRGNVKKMPCLVNAPKALPGVFRIEAPNGIGKTFVGGGGRLHAGKPPKGYLVDPGMP